MSYALGAKVLKRLCIEQNTFNWHKYKLSSVLFNTVEAGMFDWVQQHVKTHHALPNVETLSGKFPEMFSVEVPEPASYYVDLLEKNYGYDSINTLNLETQKILKNNTQDYEAALSTIQNGVARIKLVKNRRRILDVAVDVPKMVLEAYHDPLIHIKMARFGWPYMDGQSGGLAEGEIASIIGRPALGKAQPLTEPILTLQGWKPMGEVELGDKLASVDGEKSEVTAVYPQGERDIYSVTFQDGRNTEVSDEHLWEVFYREWAEPKVVTTLQLIAMLEKKRYQKRLSVRLFTGEYGTCLKEPFSPYLLGFLLGDGCFRHHSGIVSFSSADEELIERIRKELLFYGLNISKRHGYDWEIVDERHAGNRMRDWICSLGLLGLKSEKKFIPERYLNASRQIRLELVRGLMDSDGTAEKAEAVSFSSSSKKMAHQVAYLIRSLGGKARVTPKKTKRLLSYRVGIIHGNRAELFTLPRKLQRVLKDRTTHINNRLGIVSVEFAGRKECQCIQVSHPAQLYVTRDFTVTHNTWMMLRIGLCNWMAVHDVLGRNTLMASMEMMALPIAQRITAMYTGTNISQLKAGAFSTKVYHKFADGLQVMSKEGAKFYVIDSNQASTVDDIFLLADALDCKVIVIDGGHLLKNQNKRMNRFERVAENTELIKANTTDSFTTTFISWHFSREAKKKKSEEEIGLEEISNSDVIGQISSVVLGLFQGDGIETLKSRKIRVLKGRNGEVGNFSVAWDFTAMNFDQVDPPLLGQQVTEKDLLWL